MPSRDPDAPAKLDTSIAAGATIAPWVQITILYAAGAGVNMCTGLWGPLVVDLAGAVHGARQGIGLVIGAQRLPYLLGGGLAGWLAGRMGVRNTCLLGLGLTAAVDVSNMFATAMPWLIVNAIVQGMGMLSVIVGAQVAITAQTTGKAQVRALSLWATSPVLGYALGIFTASSFADGPDWRTAFILHLVLTGVLGLLVLLFARPAPTAPAPESEGMWSVVKSEGLVIRLSLGVTFAFLAASGSANVWPTYLSALHHTPVRVIGSVVAATMLCGIPGSLLAGWAMSAGLASGRVLIIVVVMAAGSAAALYFGVGGVPAMAVEMTGWYLAVGALMAVAFSILPRLVKDPAHIGASTGLLYQLTCVGSILGAPVFLSFAALPLAAPALAAVVGLCFLGLLILTPAVPVGPAARAKRS